MVSVFDRQKGWPGSDPKQTTCYYRLTVRVGLICSFLELSAEIQPGVKSKRVPKAGVKRRTSHEPTRMLMRENKGSFSFAFDSAHVKYGV